MTRLFATCFALLTFIMLSACDDVPDISLPNEPPIALDDVVNIKQNQVALIDVLANDSDIDGDTLVPVVTQTTSNGELVGIEGVITYTPNDFFIGTDSFTYEITDLVGQVATANVVINVARFETRAIFESAAGAERSLLMIDTRDPTTVVDLTQSLDGMAMLNWEISQQLDLALILTDADKLLAISLSDPATVATTYDIDTTNGPVDGGLAVSASGAIAALTLDNRFIELFDLAGENDEIEVDTGFEESTLQPAFFSASGDALILQGTLGTGAEEHAAIYYAGLITPGIVSILDDPDNMNSPFTRRFSGFNNMGWLTVDTSVVVPRMAYSCTAPPPQALSDFSQASLVIPGSGANLNEASDVLPESTAILSYNNAPFSVNLYVAACPPDAPIVQIFSVPYLTPSNAIPIATAADASDGLWNVDISLNAQRMVYVLEGDTGFRVIASDLSGDDAVETDISASVPDFRTYMDDTVVALPQTVFSSDGRYWLFLAPVDNALTRVSWIELETSELNSVDLPFAATNLVSDGFYAFVQGETAGDGIAPIATIALFDQQLDTADVPGAIAEIIADPLNEVESAINLFATP